MASYKSLSIEDIKAEIASLDEKISELYDDGYASEGNDYEVTEDDLPKLDRSFDNVVVVIGLPITVEAKKEKLVQLVLKIFKQFI